MTSVVRAMRLATAMKGLGLVAAVGCAAPACSAPADATDTSKLSIYQPLTLQDAYPTSEGKVQVQTSVGWDRTDNGHEQIEIRPVVKYGAFEHFQIALAAPYVAGAASSSRSGSFILGGFYQFAEDGLLLPAMAVSSSIRPYYGTLQGTETNTQLLLTKSLTGSKDGFSLHLNLAFRRLFDGASDDNVNRFRVVAGASLPVGRDLTVLADIVHQNNRTLHDTSTFVEAGFRLQAGNDTVFSTGFGVGLGAQSFQTRINVGLQHAFQP